MSWYIGGYYRNMSGRSVKILVSTWCFATFVFVNIYSSCLTSYMSLTFQRPEINTFRELADNPNYQLATLEGSLAEVIFLVHSQIYGGTYLACFSQFLVLVHYRLVYIWPHFHSTDFKLLSETKVEIQMYIKFISLNLCWIQYGHTNLYWIRITWLILD